MLTLKYLGDGQGKMSSRKLVIRQDGWARITGMAGWSRPQSEWEAMETVQTVPEVGLQEDGEKAQGAL